MSGLGELQAWIKTADMSDLLEVSECVRQAVERKKNEDRDVLLRVESDGIVVGHFRKDDVAGALRYLLANADDILEAKITQVRIVKSETEANLAERWWENGSAAGGS